MRKQSAIGLGGSLCLLAVLGAASCTSSTNSKPPPATSKNECAMCDQECADGLYCFNGVCARSCTVDETCPKSFGCQSGLCRCSPRGNKPICAACDPSADSCGPGLRCGFPKTSQPGQLAQCLNEALCPFVACPAAAPTCGPSNICVCKPLFDAGADTGATTVPDAGADTGAAKGPDNTGIVSVIASAYSVGATAQASSAASASFSVVTAYTLTSAPLSPVVPRPPGAPPAPFDGATGCIFQQYTGDLLAAPVKKSAGVITISGGTTTPVTLTPDGTATYAQFFNGKTPPLYAGGESITIAAAGADVPAFNATLTAPKEVTLTAPMAATPFVIDRTKSLAFTWTGGTLGNVVVTIGDAGSATKSEFLVCTFAAAGGSGTIPSAGLMKLAAGTGSIAGYVQAATSVVAGVFTNQILLSTSLLGPNGMPTFNGNQVTLQ